MTACMYRIPISDVYDGPFSSEMDGLALLVSAVVLVVCDGYVTVS